MTTFLIPASSASAELVERRSRFSGHVWHVGTEDAALSRLRETREQHPDASHNVYAYVLRESNIMRYSDDGEPSGTAGQPVLNVLRAKGVRDVCCVVTRYFGGTLLGAGGLVRAYSTAAKLALHAAGILEICPWRRLRLTCTYAQYEKIRRLLEGSGGRIESADFGAAVTVSVLLREDSADVALKALIDFSAGTVKIETIGTVFTA